MQQEARMPSEGGRDTNADSTTFAELLFYFRSPRLRRQLEKFREEYEREFGDTDLTKRYTSTWATSEQTWLLENHPKRYFDGLPPFVQAFIKEKMVSAHRNGNLDDMPANFLRLYLKGEMDIGGGYSR